MSSTSLSSSVLPTTSASSVAGATRIDLNYATAMAKGSGSIFITDGAVQTVIDRVTGQPKLRVVGGTYSKEITLDQVSISGTHVMFDATGLPAGAKLNVYMGAGTLTSGGKAAPAITVPDKASFTVPAVTEPPPPSLSATIVVEDRTLKAGADIKVTVTFSKALATLPFDAISADHASIKGVTHSTDGRTWTITLGAADSIESVTNALRLDMSKVSSSDGSRGSGVLASGNYKVDTVVDAYLFDIVKVNDEGVSSTDGITFVSGAHSSDRQFVAGVLLGELAADEHIELIINGTAVDKSKILVVGEGDGWSWSYNIVGEGDPSLVFNEGTNTITARVVKADGHTSATVTKTVILDTDPPVVESSPDGATAFALDADIVVTFDQAVYWHYEESNADILYLRGEGSAPDIEIYLDETNFSDGGKKLTISAAEHHMLAGVKYTLVLPENLMDLAGNPVFGYEIQFTTAGGTSVPDTTGPHATRVIVEGDGTYKAGETITFRVRFDESVKIPLEAIPAIGLSNGKKASYNGTYGNDLLFKYTVAAGDDTSDLEIADIAELGGTVQDLSNNMIDLLASAHIVHGGIYDNSGYGTMFDVKVDTIAPTAPAAPTLDTDSDSGTKGDGITSDNSPTLTGTAENNARIAIYDGATLIGTTTANSDGVWSTTIGYPTALTDGTYTITVKQTDRAGNVSPASAPFTLVIDTVKPAAPAASALALESDSGTPGDRITSDDTPTLTGTAEANASVEIYEGDTLLGTGTANESGVWNATVDAAHALGEGVHNLTVKQVDLAGNRSVVGGAIALTIDKTAPSALTNLKLATDTGISSSDRITNERYAVLSGTGAEAGASIKIMQGEVVVGVGTSDGEGNWNAYFGSPLNEGEHTYKVRQIDAAGHASADSPAISFTLDRTGPESAPPKPQLDSSSDTGVSSSDGITRDSTPTFTGSGAMANSMVALFANERQVASAITDASGNWTMTIHHDEELDDGFYSIGLKQFDVAGNKSPYSESFNLRIDTHADKPERPVLAAASDSGSSNSDGITNDTTPTFSGNGAENGAGIVLYAGTRVIGSTTADSAGHWELTVLDADKFTADGSYAITAKQTDKAGNTSDASNPFTLVIDTSGPTVTSFLNKTSARESQLGFSEQIVFKPTGMFKLIQAATDILSFSGSSASNWYVTDGAGGHDSVLNFKISMSGLYNLHMNNEAVQDLAGNVAIIGSPQWVVDLPAPPA